MSMSTTQALKVFEDKPSASIMKRRYWKKGWRAMPSLSATWRFFDTLNKIERKLNETS